MTATNAKILEFPPKVDEEKKTFPLKVSPSNSNLSYSSEYIPISEFEFDLPHIIDQRRSIKTTMISRTHYTQKIIDCLEWLSKNHIKSPDSIPYIEQLLDNLKTYKDEYYNDKFSAFYSALYDALAYKSKWTEVTQKDFESLIEIIVPLNNSINVSYKKIDKSINKLDKIGLDTTPF